MLVGIDCERGSQHLLDLEMSREVTARAQREGGQLQTVETEVAMGAKVSPTKCLWVLEV